MTDWHPDRLAEVIPEGHHGSTRVEYYEITPQRSHFTMLRQALNPSRDEYIPAGQYIGLYVDGCLMMSNTPMEVRSNRSVVRQAHGRVLIAGLGLGMILHGILPKPEVKDVTVVEINADVIALVEPHMQHDKLTVIYHDIFSWKPGRGERYNVIYFDIWQTLCGDNLEDMAKLHRRFGRYLDHQDSARYMDSWQRSWLRSDRRRVGRR